MMGYMCHHAIIVTSCIEGLLDRALIQAQAIFEYVSPISKKAVNGYQSFFIPPDGSKEGWGESDDGDERRQHFIDWLTSQAFEDGSNSLTWIEVQYGDGDHDDKISRSYLDRLKEVRRA